MTEKRARYHAGESRLTYRLVQRRGAWHTETEVA